MDNKDFILFHKPHVTQQEIDEVVDTIKSGWWTTGPKTFKFENEFKNYIGSQFSVSANSWTAAGHLALEAIGLKAGDEVIIPSITFTATAEIICYFGAKPVIVDVQPGTLNIDPHQIEKAITKKTKAIIPVHFGGLPCDMDEILAIAKKNNLVVIEDAAHALPAKYKGKMIGNISDITCFSFYATKTLATGEGGMLTTNNKEYADRCAVMRLHGINKDAWKRYSSEGSWFYEVIAPGYKYNFTDIQASLGLVQLAKVEGLWNMRKEIAAKYTKAFKNNDLIELHEQKSDSESALHLYPIFINIDKLKIKRSEVINLLKDAGIGTSVHFIPLYRHPYYKETFNLNEKDYPVSEYYFPREISLPLWPGMTNKQINYVINSLTDILEKNKI
ncbi:MAG TPA: DegT/DnrJ/EryC1/StrS family aminotransferase [Ignavibacteriaceae bacterium]|nr:DegT/DnrJ/EryC1/StrS family aminotransferase [Ignavibacteriaceae bacterium]